MTRERYESISLHDLREIAKNRGMRRISTLKKAELIDAMLQKDEEEAKILREEKIQRRKEQMQQMQEADPGQGGRMTSDNPESDAAKTRLQADRPAGTDKGPDNEDGRQNAQARDGSSRDGRDNRQRNMNTRGRQSAGAYTAGRRAPGRPRRDERQNSGSRQVRENRQPQAAGQTSYPADPSAETAGTVAREQSSEYNYQQNAKTQEGSRSTVPSQTAPAAGGREQQDLQQEAARLSRIYQPGRPDTPVLHKDELNADLDSGQMANGILEVMQDGFGFIRCANYMPGENDIYVAPSQIRRFGLKTGDIIVGNIRVKTQGEKFSALLFVKSVNGFSPEEATRRYNFEDMTPVFPDERIRLERSGGTVSMRIMDLMCPVGKGQRGMIVSPPKAGKTTLIKDIARSVKYNNPEIHLIVLLIDERPEEVTDIREAIEGPNTEVIYSTFDELPEHHKRVSEMVIERARRLVEHKKDVMILLDSITRLTRAYNITEPSSGRTLSGGLDPAALHMPKRFFGAARNMREGGSLTILATALIDTGSKMDDIVFEEFKGTGNMELVLDRRLSERRIFPAIDIVRSGTRREDLLLTPDEYQAINTIRRSFNGLSSEQAVTQALNLFSKTRTNGEFINMVRKVQWGRTE